MISPADVERLDSLTEDQLFAELGQAIKSGGLEMLPDAHLHLDVGAQGKLFFDNVLPVVQRLICNPQIADYVRDEKKRDVVNFVACFVDVIVGYFHIKVSTVILVQVYKMGVDRFCGMPLPSSGDPNQVDA